MSRVTPLTPLTLVLLAVLAAVVRGTAQDTAGKDYRQDAASIKSGQELFTRYCAACHNFETAEIGPSLRGVTRLRDRKWLTSFIRNAPEMVASGDARAVQLHQQYKLGMPPFTMLSADEIEQLLAYMHTFPATATKAAPERPGALADPIPEKIASSGLTLVLTRVLTMPTSANEPPATRINKLLAVDRGFGERLLIHDLRGRLYEIRDKTPHLLLDVGAAFPRFIHVPGLGTGFGSFAFHPDFVSNGLFYTTHTEPAGAAPADFRIADPTPVRLQWVLVEWKADNVRGDTLSGARRELLRADMHTQVHGFQALTFNPLAKKGDADFGLLYLAVGDGGAGVTKYWSTCCRSGIWGSVLRIDPAGRNSANGRYGIPSDNPQRIEGNPPREVWVRGFRNPHRITWDVSGSRKMFITDIGHQMIEEVNLGAPGRHYGWPEREGTFLIELPDNPKAVYPRPVSDSVAYTYPAVQYDHDEGNAVSGGFVYAGDRIALLKGKYIFGDIPRGRVFFTDVARMEPGRQAPIFEIDIEVDGKKTDFMTLTANKRTDLRFGQDGAGDLYIFTKADGAVWKVVDCR